MQTPIVQIVYSPGLRLPKSVLPTLDLARDSRLSIQTKAGSIVLTPLQSPRSPWQATFMAAPAGEPDNLWSDLPLAESWD
jgi:antitoxin component of MazEF toxin-antitoxin module